LVELMAVVAILGVMASIAVPSFIGYTRRARASEAVSNLGSLFSSAASLYVSERATIGVGSTILTNCVAESTALTPATPTSVKQHFTASAGFVQLGFTIADYVYYGYGITSVVGAAGKISCSTSTALPTNIYTFYAHGDLDGDTTQSTFELAVSSNADSQLYHARGLYIANELE
jgi:type IV pilus assembly protein PilA